MSLPPESYPPDKLNELERAIAIAKERIAQQTAKDETTQSLGDIATEASDILEQQKQTSLLLDIYEDDSAIEALEKTLKQSTILFARIGLTPPSINTISNVINLASYTDIIYQDMRDQMLEPAWVLTPLGMSFTEWKALFNNLSTDKSITYNTIKCLVLNETTLSKLSDAEYSHSFNIVPDPMKWNKHWSLSLIPATQSPSDLGLTPRKPSKTSELRYPTIAEYLSLQALRIQSGLEPIDKHTRTWLKGTLGTRDSIPLCPVGNYDDGYININLVNIYHNDNTLGVRLGF